MYHLGVFTEDSENNFKLFTSGFGVPEVFESIDQIERYIKNFTTGNLIYCPIPCESEEETVNRLNKLLEV